MMCFFYHYDYDEYVQQQQKKDKYVNPRTNMRPQI